MTSLLKIYQKALRSLDDPDITNLVNSGDEIAFCKLMHQYWENAFPRFDNPFVVANMLRSSTYSHSNLVEEFEADGITSSFTVPIEFDLEKENVLYGFWENEKKVVAVLNLDTRQITFPTVLPLGQIYIMEQYYIGDTDISKFSVSEQVKIIDILALLIVKAWADEASNYLLDRHNIVFTSDFGLHSNASVASAKDRWVNNLDAQITQAMNQFSWLRKANGVQGVVT